DQLKTVVDFAGAGIVVQDDDEVRIVRQHGPASYTIPPHTRIPMSEARPLWDLIAVGQRLIIDDVRGESTEARTYRELVGESMEAYPYIRSWVAVPMRVKDRDIGALFLAHSEPNVYTSHHADLALAIAQQAAIAIENARLYERAQELAALEERQRLSRELHDSVSQALYSIALGARTARALVGPDSSRLAEPLDFVLAQAARGMAEMRALIFALRPEALEQEGLVAALARQAEAVQARHDLPVEAALGAEPDLPLPAKEALYRIAQEALHNAVKHARARHIRLALSRAEGEIALEVRDDGTGFDPAGSFPGHLGLSSMRERVVPLRGRWRSRAQRVRAR
ncbi:MAG: sensor histidine kinase, partial [Chloroflexi bacterium]|nr:sensor histidine kinase [Chloroflexota bacterium]